MSSIFSKALMLLLGLGVILSVETWRRARQELQVVTAANTSMRKTLGDLIVAITEKDKEIDHLAQSPCNAGERSQ
jgi:hypothetical protein